MQFRFPGFHITNIAFGLTFETGINLLLNSISQQAFHIHSLGICLITEFLRFNRSAVKLLFLQMAELCCDVAQITILALIPTIFLNVNIFSVELG